MFLHHIITLMSNDECVYSKNTFILPRCRKQQRVDFSNMHTCIFGESRWEVGRMIWIGRFLQVCLVTCVRLRPQAVAPCLMNMAALCQFWPNKLQLSPEIQQTPRLCAWSPSRGEPLLNLLSLTSLSSPPLSISVNSRALLAGVIGGVNKSRRESWKRSKCKPRDWLVSASDCAHMLGWGFSFAWLCCLPLDRRGPAWCWSGSDCNSHQLLGTRWTCCFAVTWQGQISNSKTRCDWSCIIQSVIN